MCSVIPNVTIIPTAPAPAPLIEGRDALVLDCEVDSNPAPAISWYKDIQTDGSGVPRLQVTMIIIVMWVITYHYPLSGDF